MASAAGTILLQDDGRVTLDESGRVLTSDGTSDCDCCGETPTPLVRIWRTCAAGHLGGGTSYYLPATEGSSDIYLFPGFTSCMGVKMSDTPIPLPLGGTILHPAAASAVFPSCASCGAGSNNCDSCCGVTDIGRYLLTYAIFSTASTLDDDGILTLAGTDFKDGSYVPVGQNYFCSGDAGVGGSAYFEKSGGFWQTHPSTLDGSAGGVTATIQSSDAFACPPTNYVSLDDWTTTAVSTGYQCLVLSNHCIIETAVAAPPADIVVDGLISHVMYDGGGSTLAALQAIYPGLTEWDGSLQLSSGTWVSLVAGVHDERVALKLKDGSYVVCKPRLTISYGAGYSLALSINVSSDEPIKNAPSFTYGGADFINRPVWYGSVPLASRESGTWTNDLTEVPLYIELGA